MLLLGLLAPRFRYKKAVFGVWGFHAPKGGNFPDLERVGELFAVRGLTRFFKRKV
jgi:hypothetical protein